MATGLTLQAADVVAASLAIKEPLRNGDRLFWAEQPPKQKGRTTLMLQRDGKHPKELTPAPFNLRTRNHEFGGGLYAVAEDQVCFINATDGAIWLLELGIDSSPKRITAPRINRSGGYADGLIDQKHQRWIGVLEDEERDWLVAVPLGGGEPQVLRGSADFCGYAVLSPQEEKLAWLEWNLPWMPWERTELWWSPLGEAGELKAPRCLLGGGDAPQSLFQPIWAGETELLVASDCNGFWNVQRIGTDIEAGSDRLAKNFPLGPRQAECAMPQWVYGMRTLAIANNTLLALFCEKGEWQLCRRELNASDASPWQVIPLPFNDLAVLSAAGEKFVCLASGPKQREGLLQFQLGSGEWNHSGEIFEQAVAPQSIWFEGGDGEQSQAWYYPPLNKTNGLAPLLVRSHSGPTAMARPGMSLANAYWNSRGWGVVDVNYGGSTGFGRSYRQRLDGKWGLLDSADCAAAAKALIKEGAADPARVAIEGGSAGGFTTLSALIREPVFKAGVCRYAVADVEALKQGTHRFESGYVDRLLGDWRWPGLVALTKPVLFFQGLQDRVVPPQQTEMMVRGLRRQGQTVEVVFLEEEGHGFRSELLKAQILETTERFLNRVLPEA
jgi:dipeptidyl aminopeptidase/acylaminoacyl peptidase